VNLGKKRVGDQHQNQREQELGDREAEQPGRNIIPRRYPGRNRRVAVRSRFGWSFRGFLADGGVALRSLSWWVWSSGVGHGSSRTAKNLESSQLISRTFDACPAPTCFHIPGRG
jgi:hypothetical protein